MKYAFIIAAALLLAPASVQAGTATADCVGPGCDEVNEVCARLGIQTCLEAAPAAFDCIGGIVCDTVRDLCGGCIDGTDASSTYALECGLDGCEPVDSWCYDLDGRPCLGPVYRLDEQPCTLTASACAWLDSWCYDLDGRTCTSIVFGIVDAVTVAQAADPALDCMGKVCDLINEVCGGCVDMAGSETVRCGGNDVCDAVNAVCGGCIPDADADSRIRCDDKVSHAVCDTYSLVCYDNPVDCPPIRAASGAETARIDCYDSTHPYCTYYEGWVCSLVPDCIRFLDEPATAESSAVAISCPPRLPHCVVVQVFCDVTGSPLCQIIA